ncbi:hypothetical protein FOL46_005988 [Perkinsus olseni]|uniref:FAD-binding FR-type domain-containing protein n=1 Tax=Perkinsus olseni TaxID=32597 RepID=A0A7J6LP28_PEROL|nr:hypothetical protein FOL46_005988 [Perkinsus olseni]
MPQKDSEEPGVVKLTPLTLAGGAAALAAAGVFTYALTSRRAKSSDEKLGPPVPRASQEDPKMLAKLEASRNTGMKPYDGAAQSPDIYFQNVEAANPYYDAVPEHLLGAFDMIKALTGREYNIFDYEGDPNATHVFVVMGAGSSTVAETIAYLAKRQPRYKLGLVRVRLLRPWPINSPYEITSGCEYVAVHKKEYVKAFDASLILGASKPESILVLNAPWLTVEELDEELPSKFKLMVAEKRLKLFVINASLVAKESGMGRLINNIMQAVFFRLSGVLPYEQALPLFEAAIEKTYKNKGADVVRKNILAVGYAIDNLHKIDVPFSRWMKCERLDQVKSRSEVGAKPEEEEEYEALFEVTSLPVTATEKQLPYHRIVPPGSHAVPVRENRRMTPMEYERDIRHIVLDISAVDLPFRLGDAITLYPQNLREDVDNLFDEVLMHLDRNDVVSVKCLSEDVPTRLRSAFTARMPTKQIFTELLDIFGKPSRSFYKQLARISCDEGESKQLTDIANDDVKFKKLLGKSVSYAEVLKMFPKSAKSMTLVNFLETVPLLKPRLYSIANSSFYSPGIVELTVVINRWTNSDGRLLTGTSTKYLGFSKDTKMCVSVASGTFVFPEDERTPMVMAGLGTGIAPIRAFVQDRMYKRKVLGMDTGPMIVFYGCRHEKEEFLYRDEWKAFVEAGVLTKVINAFSHDQDHMIFVQHKMAENPELLYKYIQQLGGYFYFCGPSVAVPDVEAAMKNAVRTVGKMTEDEVELWFENDIKAKKRYSTEAY